MGDYHILKGKEIKYKQKAKTVYDSCSWVNRVKVRLRFWFRFRIRSGPACKVHTDQNVLHEIAHARGCWHM